jgi:hypothetical protein
MRKNSLNMQLISRTILLFLLFLALGFSQDSQKTLIELSTDIEVPVRVFSDGVFVESLRLEDFQIFEEGDKQSIQAVFRVKGGKIVNRFGSVESTPNLTRNFYFFVEISKFTPEIQSVLETFLTHSLDVGDNLTIITPQKTYRLKNEAIEKLHNDDILNQLRAIFEKNSLLANTNYSRMMVDINHVVQILASINTNSYRLRQKGPTLRKDDGTTDIEGLITRYLSLLNKIIILRKVSELRYSEYADLLRYQNGQKYAFLFYEREPLPKIDGKILQIYLSHNQERPDIIQNLEYPPAFAENDIDFDIARQSKEFSNSSVMFNVMLFGGGSVAQTGPKNEGLLAISRATGAIIDSSWSPEKNIKTILNSLDDYYLLYYSPKEYTGDGKYKRIEVRVNRENYRIAHRSGYFSN